MSINTGVNSTTPNTIKWAGAGSDPYVRASQLAGPVENFDLHDHSSGMCLPVARGAFTAATPVTVSSATALTVARTGTNYALQVDTVTASSATGLKITASAAAAGLALAVISSGTDEGLTLNAKGAGTIVIGTVSTGAITLGRATTVSAALTVSTGGIIVTGNSTITGTLGGLTGLTVASGGITATGNSTITGSLGGVTTLATSGAITNTATNGHQAVTIVPGTATNGATASFNNTGGIMYVGLDNSAAGNFGVGNYAGIVWSPTNIELIPGATTGNRVSVATSGAVTMRSTLAIAGALTGVTTLATSSTINSQTISASANLTGTLVVASTLTQTAGIYYQGDTSNADMTLGHTINQGAANDHILAFKASAVGHGGLNGAAETDTYGAFKKVVAAEGGLWVEGLTETITGLSLVGTVTTEDTAAKGTTSTGAVHVRARKGGSGNTMSANANMLVVQTDTITRFVLDADGDSHQDVGTSWTNYHTHDDLSLLNDLSFAVTRDDDPIKQQFGGFLKYNKEALEKSKIVSFNDDTDGRPFVNMSKLTMALVGANLQMGDRIRQLEDSLADVRALVAGA